MRVVRLTACDILIWLAKALDRVQWIALEYVLVHALKRRTLQQRKRVDMRGEKSRNMYKCYKFSLRSRPCHVRPEPTVRKQFETKEKVV